MKTSRWEKPVLRVPELEVMHWDIFQGYENGPESFPLPKKHLQRGGKTEIIVGSFQVGLVQE